MMALNLDSVPGMTQHLFISANGDMLARWRLAFGSSESVPARVLSDAFKSEFAWVRLQAGTPVAQQVQAVRRHLPDAAVIVLSDTPSDEEGMLVFSAGVRGYCNSHASEAVLRQVAAVVSQGGLWIGESLMERLLVGMSRLPLQSEAQTAGAARSGSGANDSAWQGKLTEREWEVAQAVAAGASNKEVARQLGITERTVKAHVGVIFTKLDVPDRLHLALRMRGMHPSQS
jgi:two-component system nitrate/nitrite response regulator NarL